MSKAHRDRKRRIGMHTVHKQRQAHAMDGILPLETLREEVSS